jgi:hypothetical protein
VRDTGEVVTTVDGVGLGARIELAVPAGSYALVVDGVGAGDPGTTGYSDYASLGRYRITGTLPGIAEDQPDPGTGEPEPDVTVPDAPAVRAEVAADGSVLLTWGADASVTQFEVYGETRHKSGAYRARTLLGTVAGSGSSWTDDPGSGTFRYQVVARNAAGAAESAYSVVTVSSSGSDGSTKGGGKGKPGTAKVR